MSIRRPPLHEKHLQSGADFTDFGGWDMPVSFDSITAEHAAVRNSAGIFDVSHMGEVTVGGPDATDLMNRLTTNDVTELDPGDAQYACILAADGTIIDDTVVYFQPGGDEYLFVPNAGNDEMMTDRWIDHAAAHDLDATVSNRTAALGMFAVQGPNAVENVQAAAADPLEDMAPFSARETTIDGADCLAARTGYTGEDGFELIFDADDSETVWDAFDGVQSCGLGARDTLRLEAGLLLSGQDFHPDDEPRTPYEARLSFVVDSSKPVFVGQESLRDADHPNELLVGLELDERAVPRHGYPILRDGEQVGHVTSGTMSPTLEVPIALGYVDAAHVDEGTSLGVEVRNQTVAATVANHRFLQEHRD
ncbi:glycine cleavage system aminomethyltransferase GcvT [Halobacterium noricense]|uniref:glycine cleavage system aminomethyltransferase GcvT n=1 Tax=Halobacterium noricense TaxID=223182 RepID=UPI001E37B83C|nr:glycine cleavage system aminomethyltransferase GcvT [Halobacterium noricense]UHH23995.1 glycine cleavage system aminomethyltransferase GcvT [Halobacterium noricense]